MSCRAVSCAVRVVRLTHTVCAVRVAQVALRDFGSITMDKVKQLRNSYKLQVIIDLEDEKRR